MSGEKRSVLVFGATGQQGGSVTAALTHAGWPVIALVRDLNSLKSEELRRTGVELVQGDLGDTGSIRAAMKGVYGVFSVQPSSGQGAMYGVSDEDEVRYGTGIADIAVESGVQHLVYSSTGAVGDEPTGMGHFDSKARIEAHIHTLKITATVIRPVTFMEMLLMPGFGLDQGRFNFFVRPDQAMQVLAVQDIGRIVATIFGDAARFGGETIEIASDAITGQDLEALFAQAAGRPITYSRFTDEVLAANPFLKRLTDLVDAGRLTGKANLETLREINPDLQSFQCWLAGSGRKAFLEALGKPGDWSYGHDCHGDAAPS